MIYLTRTSSTSPLTKGTVKYDEAQKVIHTMMNIGIFITVIFAALFAKNPLMALICLALYVQLGHSYNDGLNKVTIWKWLPEALCYMFLAGYAYFIGGSEVTFIFQLSLLYMFLVIMYQIYWEGELKEILFFEEVNILRHFGVRVENDTLFIPRWLQASSYLINIIKLVVGYVVVYLVSGLLGVVIYTVGAAITMYYVHKMTKAPRKYIHDKELEYMGNAEAFNLVMFTIAVMAKTIQSLLFGIFLALFSIGWYFIFNKIQWGVAKRPQV